MGLKKIENLLTVLHTSLSFRRSLVPCVLLFGVRLGWTERRTVNRDNRVLVWYVKLNWGYHTTRCQDGQHEDDGWSNTRRSLLLSSSVFSLVMTVRYPQQLQYPPLDPKLRPLRPLPHLYMSTRLVNSAVIISEENIPTHPSLRPSSFSDYSAFRFHPRHPPLRRQHPHLNHYLPSHHG